MGRGGRGGGRGGGKFRGKGKNRSGRGDVRSEPWSDIKRQNDLYESYYRSGGFLEEEEFEQMWKALASDLPNSFRFTGTKADALAVREIFKRRYIPGIKAVKFEGEPVLPPEPVKAFPDDLVWDMKTHKKIVRRHKPFAEFQKFLVAETTSGNISRQEVVSMIPPHFLDVRPGMVVLDMCAAPGSKSAQLAEMIHGDEEDRVKKAAGNEAFNSTDDGDYSDDGRSTGLLIANDTDYKRAGMLVHQVKRLNFPNLIVTQHDASIFPSIELPSLSGSQKAQYLKFDRILCDVPCSGDGTARKNPNVWQKWTPRDGLGLHNLQLRILSRGLQLLRKGGRLVYSTCSMNPVENEAVVASAIELCGGNAKVRLVDCSDHLPNLIRKPGLNKWKVLDTSHVNGEDKINHMFTSWDAFQKTKEKYDEEGFGRQFSSKIAQGVFPPISTSEGERIPLEHCVRVYPHLQDTGGFFIAVLEKLDDIKVVQPNNLTQAKAESANVTPAPTSSKRKLDDADDSMSAKRAKTTEAKGVIDDVEVDSIQEIVPPSSANVSEGIEASKPTSNGADALENSESTANGTPTPQPKAITKLKPESHSQQKEYYEYLAADDPTIRDILEFFGISERFPRDRFLVRNKEGLLLNKIYYTSALAKTIIQANKDRGMKFIHCGVVMFVAHKIKDRDTLKAPWRLQNEGIRILEPWASKRIIICKSRATLHRMLIEMFPKLPKDGKHELGKLGDQLVALDIGCCFLRIEQKNSEIEDEHFPFPMVLPVWRHPGSINLMVDKDDRKAILLRLFNEQDPQIINHVVEKAKAAERKEAENAQDEADAGNGVDSGAVEGQDADVKLEDVEGADVEEG